MVFILSSRINPAVAGFLRLYVKGRQWLATRRLSKSPNLYSAAIYESYLGFPKKPRAKKKCRSNNQKLKKRNFYHSI
jgi:hypothetical protein